MSTSQGSRPRRPAAPLYERALRARRLRRRVRRGRRRAVAGAGAAAGPRGAGRARPSRGVRGGRRVERRRRRRAAARSLAAASCWPAMRAADRPGIVSLFLPRGRAAGARARALVEATFAGAGLPIVAWRAVPFDAARARCRGRRLATGLRAGHRRAPVARRGRPAADLGRRLRAPAGRRPAPARDGGARGRRRAGRARPCPSASARTIVYKGLVIGGRLPDLYPDLRAPLSRRLRGLPPALRDEHAPGLAARPAVPLDRPQRRDQHGPRQPRAGPRPGRRRRRRPRSPAALLAAGPLLSADGSDSLSLDEALELLTTTGWDLTPALLTAIPEALGAAPRAASARRHAAPPDGRLPRAVGRAGRDRLRRRPAGRRAGRPQRAATGGLRGDPRPARGRRVRGRRRAVQRRRDGPARPARAGRAAAGRAGPAGDPRGHRGEGLGPSRISRSTTPPRPTYEDRVDGGDRRGRRPPRTDHVLRYLAGLDAERARLDIKTMALEGHEPLWSMGDDTPTPGRGRLDRPVADHLRQAFAQVTNPAIDPERERVVMDLRVELGRRPALLGGPPRGAADRPPGSGRSSSTSTGCSPRCVPTAGHGPDARCDLGSGRRARPVSRPRSIGWRPRPSPRRGAAPQLLVLTDAAWSLDRLPIPSILATGAVHTALTAAGLRGRTDLAVSAVDILDVHAMAMVLAVGATAVQPRLAIELAAELAGTRGAETLTPDRDRRRPGRRVRGRPAQDAGPDGHQRRRVVHRRRADRRRRPRRDRSSRAASRPPPRGPAGRRWPTSPTRQIRRRAAALAIPEPAAGREPRLPDPGFARFRADGEAHLFSPRIAGEIKVLSRPRRPTPTIDAARDIDAALARYRAALARPPTDRSVPRDELRVRARRDARPARRGRGRPRRSSAASSSRR